MISVKILLNYISVYTLKNKKDKEVLVLYELSQISVKPATYSLHIFIISPATVFLKSMNLDDRAFTLIQKNDVEFLLFSFKTLCVSLALCYLFIYDPAIFHF